MMAARTVWSSETRRGGQSLWLSAHLRAGPSLCLRIQRQNAFTLIELILVMAILTIAVSITAPALANFFHGRVLDSEARRLLAATRAAQSRSISEGVPVTLWFDSSQNEYGIEAETGAYEKDQKAETLVVDHNVSLKVTTLNIGASRANASFGTSMGSGSSSGRSMASTPTPQGPHAGLPQIRFLPDGSIGEESPQMIQIIGSDESSLWLALSRGRLNYELQSRANY